MSGDVHYDQTLTDYAVGYFARKTEYVANQAAPPSPVKRRADRYSVYSRNDFGRDEFALREAGADAVELEHSVSSDTFYCEDYGGRVKVIWQERDNDDDPAAYEEAKLARLLRAGAIRRERLFAATALLNTSWASTNRMVGTASSTASLDFIRFQASGADPVDTIQRAHDLISLGTAGERGNTLVVTPDVHRALKTSSAILDRIKYTGGEANPSLVTPKALAALFDVEKYLIVRGSYNSSVEGNATQTHAFVATNSMVLMYQAPEKFAPTALRQFSWSEYDQAMSPDRTSVRRYDEDSKRVTWLEADICCDFKIVADTAGVHFATVLTS